MFQRARLVTGAKGSRLTLRARLVGLPFGPLDYDPAEDGFTLATGAAAVVVGPATGGGCRHADGWHEQNGATTATYTYRNASGALRPACAPGSADGLRSIRVVDALARDGTVRVQLKAKGAPIQTTAGTFAVTLVFGDESAAARGACARLVLACSGSHAAHACK